MAPAKSDAAGLGGGPQRPAFGPAIWAWGPACGLVLWAVGFLILPWWAAVFLWWWPSILFGAALGLATIGLAKWLARLTGARDRAARSTARPTPRASLETVATAPIRPGPTGASSDPPTG